MPVASSVTELVDDRTPVTDEVLADHAINTVRHKGEAQFLKMKFTLTVELVVQPPPLTHGGDTRSMPTADSDTVSRVVETGDEPDAIEMLIDTDLPKVGQKVIGLVTSGNVQVLEEER